MTHPDYTKLIKQLVSASITEQMAAKMILLAMQEDAIDPLADIFYAGVNNAEGRAIIDIVATIGGYNAILLLKQIFQFNENKSFVTATAQALLHHSDVLTQDERQAIAEYLLDTN